ncbi:ROK family protein [Anaerobranca gottschalkii]|uniref:fructokinase n=1 Tax=Anaerobranca gottschalkii DSM 13577 TaxID=1120990 RepID=A0A1H9YIS0_9FIRM|nr:ROK family protein [Anaerobranca gottschalkii]SES68387.1 fructokinase [Anaerobranca gottschalkii DSM 13577]
MLYGGIEAGGTKFICAVADENKKILDKIQLPTLEPEITLSKVIEYFRKFKLKSLGIGCFGPIDINPASKTFGFITNTPKLPWRNYPIVNKLKATLNLPIGFNTDVNAAALAEACLGGAKGLDSCLYITVGTGIGAGAIVHGKILQGLCHPEMGHILIRRHEMDNYKGKCPYHQDCLEGLASGPAIEERWGEKGVNLGSNEGVWELESFYLAQAIVQYILILSPKKIILGGGVMRQKQIYPLIRMNVLKILNNYLSVPEIIEQIDQYIIPPGLGENSGIIGAILLGELAYKNKSF